jgi:aspartyl-tRNA(Asn)/glutamyl-tRNA(Gln) amidotransferase subunit B
MNRGLNGTRESRNYKARKYNSGEVGKRRRLLMQYEAVIGLEIHAQLSTESKIFCGCSTEFGSEPNTQTCPVCTGLPGVLPVMNKKAIEYVVRTGLAVDCTISPVSRFARKNYFYPDLPKGYQISQFELPLCDGGHVDITVDGTTKRIRLNRIHLEEDAGKNIHEGMGLESSVDLNRAGVPLMEIVTEPDLCSSQEAVEFMKKLRSIVRCIGVSDGNMEQGSLRCDVNVSVRPVGTEELGVKTEIKNMNSFRFVEKALDYEIKRQKRVLNEGGKITQETRLYDVNAGSTDPMRSKEESHDYRYFPDPDLMPIELDPAWVEEIKAQIPELPDVKQEKFINKYNLPEQDAYLISINKSSTDFFEDAVRLGGNPISVSNWMKGDFAKSLNEENKSIEESLIKAKHIVELLELIDKGTISGKIAKTVFEEMYRTGKDAATVVNEKGLVQVSDESELEKIVDDIISNSPDEVERFKGGEAKLMGFFVGQIMKQTKGKANPKIVNELLKNKLK